jgi:ubiquinone/menaquinone biosynthesis C-methylase UbiE
MPSDPTGWDAYWSSKSSRGSALYDTIATWYRNAFIRAGLKRSIAKHFPNGARLLHAGCGSGQVDVGLPAAITAVDLSAAALVEYGRANGADSRRVRASVFELPFPDGSFDGAYNLGVIEHFTADEIQQMLGEMRRVVKPDGKIVIFWPHHFGSSVNVLRVVHFLAHRVLRKNLQLHPPEISLVRSRNHAERVLAAAGLRHVDYSFSIRDGFVQAVVVARRQ